MSADRLIGADLENQVPEGEIKEHPLFTLQGRVIRSRETEEEVRLLPAEAKIVSYMIDYLDFVLSREQISEGALGYGYIKGQRSIDVHMRRIREQMGEIHLPNLFLSVRGLGYQLRSSVDPQLT